MKEQLEQLQFYFDNIPVALALIEAMSGRSQTQPSALILRYANQRFARLCGCAAGRPDRISSFSELFPEINETSLWEHRLFSPHHRQESECIQFCRGADTYLKLTFHPWPRAGYWVCSLSDETEAVSDRKRLELSASFDLATNTKNRNAYVDFCQSYPSNQPTGVLFVDVNGLKACNDTYGHSTGDCLIRQVADRINLTIAGMGCPVFRVGGDEFIVVLGGYSQAAVQETALQLERVLVNQTLSQFSRLLASVGRSWSGSPPSIEALVRQADADMYRRKRAFYQY